jgi:1-acyl-sn-glycerol-3-phosphate acyltransferase
MSFVFRLLGIAGILENFVGNIKKIGWYRANQRYIADLGIKLDTSLRDFPKKGGILVYANHPTGLDPFILSSVLGRDDVYFLSDVYHAKKGEGVQEHMIPVYYSNWRDLWKRSGLAFGGFILMRLTSGFLSADEVRARNRQAIEIAVQKLREGHVVLIFPSGGDNEQFPWKKGIGEIILQMKEVRFILYECQISHVITFHLLRHFLTGRIFLKRQPIEISGKLKSVTFLDSIQDPVSITAFLQADFLRNEV